MADHLRHLYGPQVSTYKVRQKIHDLEFALFLVAISYGGIGESPAENHMLLQSLLLSGQGIDELLQSIKFFKFTNISHYLKQFF